MLWTRAVQLQCRCPPSLGFFILANQEKESSDGRQSQEILCSGWSVQQQSLTKRGFLQEVSLCLSVGVSRVSLEDSSHNVPSVLLIWQLGGGDQEVNREEDLKLVGKIGGGSQSGLFIPAGLQHTGRDLNWRRGSELSDKQSWCVVLL